MIGPYARGGRSGAAATSGQAPGIASYSIAIHDGLVKNRFTDGFAKNSKFKAREPRVMRRTYRTPQ